MINTFMFDIHSKMHYIKFMDIILSILAINVASYIYMFVINKSIISDISCNCIVFCYTRILYVMYNIINYKVVYKIKIYELIITEVIYEP